MEVYEGTWQQNKRTGLGKHTWPDGKVYEGIWHEDQRSGEGK